MRRTYLPKSIDRPMNRASMNRPPRRIAGDASVRGLVDRAGATRQTGGED